MKIIVLLFINFPELQVWMLILLPRLYYLLKKNNLPLWKRNQFQLLTSVFSSQLLLLKFQLKWKPPSLLGLKLRSVAVSPNLRKIRTSSMVFLMSIKQLILRKCFKNFPATIKLILRRIRLRSSQLRKRSKLKILKLLMLW